MPETDMGRQDALASEDDRVTLVVVSHNRCAQLLESLRHHRAPVVLVDNASTDGTADAVRADFPQTKVLQLDRNAGAFARTIGVRQVTTPYVGFADDDSSWEPGSLHHAAEALERHPRLGLVGARILVGPEQRLDPVCLELAASPLRDATCPGRPVLGFVACAAMVRVKAFRRAGGFDDIIRFPGEEERLALDLAADEWQLAYLDDLVVHHHPSGPRDPQARESAIARARLLTGLMRRPWRRVAAVAARTARSGPAGRSGLRQALPAMPAALRARRVPPGHVLDMLKVIERERTLAPAMTAAG